MTEILFINTNCSWNKGSAAQVISTSEILKKFIPNANFKMISYCPEIDNVETKKYNISTIGHFRENRYSFRKMLLSYSYHLSMTLFLCILHKILEKINLNIDNLSKDKYLKAYHDATVIIDLSGDSFSDKNNMSIINILGILIGFILDKPVIYFSQSIGPFNKWTLPLAKFCLNGADLIIVREDITKNYLLNTLKIISPIYATADCAFLLPYEHVDKIILDNRLASKQPLIGISASALLDNSNAAYIRLMSQLIDYIIEKLNSLIIFVPHVISPDGDQKFDDRCTGEKIYNLSKYKKNIIMINNNYPPEKLKGIIRSCDIFIGGRMHANIASLSCCVPTMAMAWSHKYYGIMKMLGQEKYICNIKTMGIEELKWSFDSLWANRDFVHKELKSKIVHQEELALLSGRLVEDLLNSFKNDI